MVLSMSGWVWVIAFNHRARSPSWQIFFILLGFLLGVAVASWLPLAFDSRALLVVALIAFFLALLVSRGNLKLALLTLCAMSLGIAHYASSTPLKADAVVGFAGQEARVEGTITNDPSSSDRFQRVELNEILVNATSASMKLLVYLPRFPELGYGDRLSFRCELEAPEPIALRPAQGNPEDTRRVDGFAYDRYLRAQGIVATCFSYDEPYVIARDQGNPFRSTVYHLRSAIELGLERALPEPHASLAKGLLLGQKVLSDEIEEDFRRVGLSHILAASGYNVSAMLSVLFAGLVFVMRRQRALYFMLIAVVLYVLLAGAEAPVVRAGIMGATALIARNAGRHTTPRNLILLAACLMLIANPLLLRDDVGFQLSLLAITGIALWADRLAKRFEFIPERFGLREAWSSSLAAITATLPLTIFQFGTLSLISPIANLLVLPLIPFAMALSALSAFSALLVPTIATWFGAPAWAVQEIILWLAHELSNIPFGFFTL